MNLTWVIPDQTTSGGIDRNYRDWGDPILVLTLRRPTCHMALLQNTVFFQTYEKSPVIILNIYPSFDISFQKIFFEYNFSIDVNCLFTFPDFCFQFRSAVWTNNNTQSFCTHWMGVKVKCYTFKTADKRGFKWIKIKVWSLPNKARSHDL